MSSASSMSESVIQESLYKDDSGNAWVRLEKTLRQTDEEEIKDYKEDMDALLVFAGLYSAVLTAFLIESYKSLNEDPQQTVIQLLREISLQTRNYTINSVSLDSTIVSSPPPSFQAAQSDILVNVCWFASLVLSLSTASYAILVKQWLREYLAIDRTVPEERIRIRYFRSLGLEEWKLFEIAATLPIVLQISLALFFVGLCFFTAEVHPSIRNTSVLLVSGWALCLTFALLAPILSPRCPYKTTFLKYLLKRARPNVRAVIVSLTALNHNTISPALGRILSRMQIVGGSVALFIKSTLLNTMCRCIRPVATVHPSPGIESEHDENSHDESHEMDASSVLLRSIAKYSLEDKTAHAEEDEVRRTEDRDLLIFRSVDCTLLDDSVLEMMRGALERRSTPGIES